ncbi:hypothetical protein FCV25MIE_20220, partial [Fagus crenata]
HHSPGVLRHSRGVVVGEAQPTQGVKEGAGKNGQRTYAGVVGRGVQAKIEKEKAPSLVVVPSQPSPESSHGSVLGNKLAIQNIPQNQAHPKVRVPLRFFPNQNISSDNRKFGTGLIISLNEGEKRRVFRKLEDMDQPLSQPRATWVPKVNHQTTFSNGPHIQAGSTQPNFEKGESSGQKVSLLGCMDLGPKDLDLSWPKVTYPVEQRVEEEPMMLSPEQSGDYEELKAEAGVVSGSDLDWFVQLKDGRRLVLPDFLPSPWTTLTDPAPPLTPCLTVPVESMESMEMPFSGTLEAEVEVVEGVFEGLSSDSVGLEVVSLPESDVLMVEPLSMLGPPLADTSSVEKPSIEFYQNPPSEWVLKHMKAIGSLVGASYGGYEDE